MKNRDSKELAGSIENALSGSGSGSGSSGRSGSRSSSPSRAVKRDTKDQVKSAVSTIKGRLDEKNKARKEDQKKRLEEVVKTLRERMDTMKESMEKKSKADVKKAVTQSKVAQKKVNQKIYKSMNKEVPAKMRSVIKNAIESFRDGRVNKNEVESLLKKNFSDKTFDGILRCAQGDLDKCNKIDLDQWKDSAIRDVDAVA